MALAIFDLDNTLIAGDSDVLWGQFLGEHGHVDYTSHERENQRHFAAYKAGGLDIMAFLRFQLRILSEHDVETLHRWRDAFVKEKIEPVLLPKARALIEKHRDQDDVPVIITATNRFITAPIAGLFGVEHLIASEPEFKDGCYTGGVSGVPSYAAGKVTRMRDWMQAHGCDLNGGWFYSDSHNDLPLLREVPHPVAVDPDPQLTAEARKRGWPIISLR
ncbi:MAG TPA: HAD family hydrolase [Gammaproteobacteria bacterium]|nr:HAD family hydrolase [Gammaproteobacteria bacterium]